MEIQMNILLQSPLMHICRRNCMRLGGCITLILLVASCAGTRREDIALAEKAAPALYNEGKGTPAEFATDKLMSFPVWVHKRILLGKYKLGNDAALATARSYMNDLFSDIDRGFNWPVKEPPRFEIPYANRKPVIDGKLDETEWSETLTFHGEYPLDSLKHNASASVWHACWDEEFLYVGASFRVSDVKSIKYDTAKNAAPWDGDAFEIFILPDMRLKAYWEVVISPDNQVTDGLHLNNSSGFWAGNLDETMHGLKTGTKITKDGFSVEAALPFKELPGYMLGNHPKTGESLSFVMIKIDKGRRSAIIPLLYDGHNIFGYPRFVLKK